MKKYTILFLWFMTLTVTNIQTIQAESLGLLEWVWDKEKLRTGNVHLEDIPNVINSMINIFLGMAWTIAVIFVIIGAYKLLLGSLKQDPIKWRETIIMALTGFAISVLSWFIVKFIFNNFSI